MILLFKSGINLSTATSVLIPIVAGPILLIRLLERIGHLIGEFAGFDMGVVLAHDLFGVVEGSGSRRVPGRADENLTSTTSSAVGHQIVVVVAEFDTCLLAQPLEDVSACVGRHRRWRNVEFGADFDQRAVHAQLLDLAFSIPAGGQSLGHPLRERRAMERGEHRPVLVWCVEDLSVHL